MIDEKEDKKVNLETEDNNIESGVNSPEIESETEKKPETLKEEIDNKAPQIKEFEKFIIEEGDQSMRIVDAVEPLPEQRKEGEEIISSIKGKTERVKKEYVKEIDVLQNSSESEVKTIGHCSACGVETRETAKFCTQCGSKLLKEEKVGQDEDIKEPGEKKTRAEILKELEEIDKKIIVVKTPAEEKKLKAKKEELLSLVYEDFNAPMGENIGGEKYKQPEAAVTQKLEEIENIIDAKKLSEETMREISKLLSDPASELSKAKKTFELWEKKLAEDEKKLADLRGERDNYITDRAKKSLRVNIINDKDTMKRRQEIMEKIINGLEEKNKAK